MKNAEKTTRHSALSDALSVLFGGLLFFLGLVLLAADVADDAPHWWAMILVSKAAALAMIGAACLMLKRFAGKED